MRATSHGIPRTRGDASLYIRPLPPIVPGSMADKIDEFLSDVCNTFGLRQGHRGYAGHPPPFTKTVQLALKQLLNDAHIDVSLKDIRIQRGMTDPKSCVAAIRPAKRFAQPHKYTRRDLEWFPLVTVFVTSGGSGRTFSGDTRIGARYYSSTDRNMNYFREILRSHLVKRVPGMARDRETQYAIATFISLLDEDQRLQNQCHEIYNHNVGGHYLRQRISHVCRQMSVTPHAWKGSRFVHSYSGESMQAQAFMETMQKLNDELGNNTIQLHRLDQWPPLELVADYFQTQCVRLEERLKSCKFSMEQNNAIFIKDEARRLDDRLSDGSEAEAIVKAVGSYNTMRDKGVKVKAILDNAQAAEEDSGACLWTHH